MAPIAQQTMQEELARLRAQRDRYALAQQSSSDDRARERHGRTIARLDEEIAALEEALGVLDAGRARLDPWGVPIVDRTSELSPDAFDAGAFARESARRTRLAALAIGGGVVAAAIVGWLAMRPSPKPPAAAPAPAPASSITVSSPVPPDPDEQPKPR